MFGGFGRTVPVGTGWAGGGFVGAGPVEGVADATTDGESVAVAVGRVDGRAVGDPEIIEINTIAGQHTTETVPTIAAGMITHMCGPEFIEMRVAPIVAEV